MGAHAELAGGLGAAVHAKHSLPAGFYDPGSARDAAEDDALTRSCGREGSTSPTHAAGSPAARDAKQGSPDGSVGDNVFGALQALGDSILRNSAGLLDDIPLSQWEQLVGLFDEPRRDEADSAPALARLSLKDTFAEDDAWMGAAPDEVLTLPDDFPAGQLDPENLFDPDVVTEGWLRVGVGSPARSGTDEFEARAHERTRAALSSVPPPVARRVALRSALESLLLNHDADMDALAERRAADADVMLPGAYVALEFGQGWEAALEESFRSVLRARGLSHVNTSDDAAAADASAATPYERATVLRIEALRRRFAAALRGFDEEMEQQAARLAALRGAPGRDGGFEDVLAMLPSAHTGAGLDSDGMLQQAWVAEASGAVPVTLLPGAALAGALAAPVPPVGAPVRKALTAAADMRLASRVAAMHRMALRAFAAAAAEAAAPEEHPESAAALAPAAAAAAPADARQQFRAAPAALRRAGRPTPASRTTLKAWMQAHFFPSAAHPHGPFPTAAEKEALADQTGLSVNQVSDWFVNARARWWKPMIEGMHRGLCDADDEPAHALPAVPEGGDGDEVMAAAEEASAALAFKQRKPRRRGSSGLGRAPPPLQEALNAATRRSSRRSSGGRSEDFDDVIAELGIEGGV